ncbi:MAG TPA: hypothetical protein VF467_17835, partial [Afipia sp.]
RVEMRLGCVAHGNLIDGRGQQHRDRVSVCRSVACPGNETCRPKRRHVAVILLAGGVVSIHARAPGDQTSAGLPLREADYSAFSNPFQRIGTLLGQEKRCLQASHNDRIYLLSSRNMWTRYARLLRVSHGIL